MPPRPLALAATALFGLAAPSGCARDRADPAPASPPPPAAPAAAAAPSTAATAPRPAGPLTWVHDDYPAALARARAARLPLFVDLWASWCHTCISMQETVLRDPAMAPFADRFVWLALDTEQARNASVLERLPPEAWPTFYVVSPVGESIEARHVGAASLAQLRELLTTGEAGHLAALDEKGALPPGPLARVRDGDRAAAAGRHADAARAFGDALARAPRDWPRAPDVLVRRASALSRGDDKEGCAELGDEAARTTAGATASAADFASIVSGCADALPPDEAAALRRRLVAVVEGVLAATPSALSADDRGDALAILRGLADKLGDAAGARAYAVRQRDVLDAAAAAAPDPWAASTYNFQRADVYTYLGDAAAIVPVLERSEADLPREYDPPYRLAGVLLALGRWDDGIAAAERARRLAVGPRQALVLGLLARLHHGKGDHAEERRLLERALEVVRATPLGQRRPSAITAAEQALARHGDEHAGAAAAAAGPAAAPPAAPAPPAPRR